MPGAEVTNLRKRSKSAAFKKFLPKYYNKTASKSFYSFTLGAMLQAVSFLLPFWQIEDSTKKGIVFELTLLGYFNHKVCPQGSNPLDCYPLQDTDPTADNMYYSGKIDEDTGAEVDNFGVLIGILSFVAGGLCVVGCAYAWKVAKKPSLKDNKRGRWLGIFIFVSFLGGLAGLALFSPGENGTSAAMQSGFLCQMFGLLFMLGGTLAIIEAVNMTHLLPAVNMIKVRKNVLPQRV